MPRGISRLLRHRQGSAPALLVFLLAMAGVAGDTAMMSTLRGYPVKDDANTVPTLGYYEALINSPPRQVSDDAPHPPPGWLPFGGDVTGIVKELPTYLRWEMKPNLDILWNGTTFQTNRLGFRTPEVTLEKPAGTYRILVFGSSNTMGYGVNNNEMYTRHLEQFLDAWTGPSQRVEVVNLAVAGDSPTRRLERMKKEAGAVERRLAVMRCVGTRLLAGRQPRSYRPPARTADSVSVRRGGDPPVGCDGGRLAGGFSRQVSRRVGANYLRVCMGPGELKPRGFGFRCRSSSCLAETARRSHHARFPVDSVALRAERARLYRHFGRV